MWNLNNSRGKFAKVMMAAAVVGLTAFATTARALTDDTFNGSDGGNPNDLQNALDWASGLPTTANTAVFDSTLAGTSGYTLFFDDDTADWGSIRFSNPASAVLISSGHTLKLEGGGIDMSSSAVGTGLTFNSILNLNALQTWTLGPGLLTVGGAVNLNSNTITFNNIGNAVISGGISGAGGITLAGGGTVNISGNNTYSGITQINNGRVVLNSGLLATSIANQIFVGGQGAATGVLDVGATGIVTAAKTSSPSITVASIAGATGIINLAGGSITATSQISMGNGASAKATITQSGATSRLTTAQLAMGVASSSTSVYNMGGGLLASSGGVGLSGGTNIVNTTSVFNFTGGTVTTATGFNVFGNGTVTATTTYSALNMTAGIMKVGDSGTGSAALIVGANNDNAMMLQTGGTISIGTVTTGNKNFDLGTANASSYAVATIIGNSVLQISTTNASKNGIYVSDNGTSTLNIGGSAQVISPFSEGVVFGKSAATANGILNLGDVGSSSPGGTLTTSIVAHPGTNGNGAALFNFHGGVLKASAASATFFAQVTNTTAYVYGEGAIIDDGGFGITIGQNLLAPPGTNGVSAISLTGAPTGYISAPIVKITGNAGASGATAYATIDGSGNASVVISNPGTGYTAGTVTLVGGGNATTPLTSALTFAANTSGALTKRGNGTLILSGANTFTGGVNLNAGALNLGSASAINTPANSGLILFGGGALQFSAANSLDYSAKFSSAINQSFKLDTNGRTVTLASAFGSSGGSLAKNGVGLLILTADNTYDTGTTATGGTLQVGAGGNTGALGTGNVALTGAILNINRDASLTYTIAGAISGSGSLTQSGAGTTILTENNSYSATVISAGTLQIGNGTTTGTLGSASVANNAALTFNHSNTFVVPNAITGTGSVSQNSASILQITGPSTRWNATGDGTTNVVAGGTIEFGGGVSHSVGTILGGGDLIVDASTTVTADPLNVNNLTVNGNLSIRDPLGTIEIHSLTVGGSGVFDITDNTLQLETNNNASALTLLHGSAAGGQLVATGNGPSTSLALLDWSLLSPAQQALFPAGTAGSAIARFEKTGDANLDGNIDGSDFNIWLADDGTSSGHRYDFGDFNGDGTVDNADFHMWYSADLAFGDGNPNADLAAQGYGLDDNGDPVQVNSVPEPASIALLSLGAAAMLTRRRKSRQA